MRNFTYSILIIFGILLIIKFVLINKSSLNTNENIINIESAEDVIGQQLIGKHCRSIKELNIKDIDRIQNNGAVLFIYNGYDCESCIKTGFKMLKSINSYSEEMFIIVIATMTNIGNDQYKYSYFEYIYNDASDLIRKELKFTPTPIFITIDTSFRIINLYNPDKLDTEGQEKYLNSLIQNANMDYW